jgi:hypothetical protein
VVAAQGLGLGVGVVKERAVGVEEVEEGAGVVVMVEVTMATVGWVTPLLPLPPPPPTVAVALVVVLPASHGTAPYARMQPGTESLSGAMRVLGRKRRSRRLQNGSRLTVAPLLRPKLERIGWREKALKVQTRTGYDSECVGSVNCFPNQYILHSHSSARRASWYSK